MIELYNYNSEDKIEILFQTVSLIRSCKDKPEIWKLNDEYLDSLCKYMHIISHDRLIKEKFLDANIDITTNSPFCIGTLNNYPLIKL